MVVHESWKRWSLRLDLNDVKQLTECTEFGSHLLSFKPVTENVQEPNIVLAQSKSSYTIHWMSAKSTCESGEHGPDIDRLFKM